MGKFLEKQAEVANQRFLNASGNDMYATGTNKFYAEGETKAVSSPIIIIADNTATSASDAVELFDASERAYDATPEVQGGVTLTSGVPNVSYKKILRGIAGGNTYLFNKLRIECLEALTDAIKESAAGASISYQVKTAQGQIVSTPIYPIISSLQQVKSIRDVELGQMLLNADVSFKIQSIPANCKMQYYFYAEQQGTPSGAMLRGDSAKQYDTPSLNALDL